jgi:hypothetical protein
VCPLDPQTEQKEPTIIKMKGVIELELVVPLEPVRTTPKKKNEGLQPPNLWSDMKPNQKKGGVLNTSTPDCRMNQKRKTISIGPRPHPSNRIEMVHPTFDYGDSKCTGEGWIKRKKLSLPEKAPAPMATGKIEHEITTTKAVWTRPSLLPDRSVVTQRWSEWSSFLPTGASLREATMGPDMREAICSALPPRSLRLGFYPNETQAFYNWIIQLE